MTVETVIRRMCFSLLVFCVLFSVPVFAEEDDSMGFDPVDIFRSYYFNTKINADLKSYESDLCKVTFNSNDDSKDVSVQFLKKGKDTKLNKNEFSREGCSFIGWSTSTSENVSFSDSQKVSFTDDVTLYANWGVLTNFDSIQFSAAGEKAALGCYKDCSCTSSDSNIVSVSKDGKIIAEAPGEAEIIVSKNGFVDKHIKVFVPRLNSREDALKPLHDMMVDTFFDINNYKYSYNSPARYTIINDEVRVGSDAGRHQSCISLPNISYKRMGLLGEKDLIWFNGKTSHNGSGKHEPNDCVKRLASGDDYINILYPGGRTAADLANSADIKYGDILCRSGHTFIYMGKVNGENRYFTGGTHRNIGNGTRLSGKSAVHNSTCDAKEKAWRNNQVPSSDFDGYSSRHDDSSSIYIVASVKTKIIKTTCINGTITGSKQYCPGQDITISYEPDGGKVLDYIEVDGNRVDTAGFESSYVFNHLSSNHTIKVVYK